ncbi:MAG: 4-hydroxy-tetrahydrodipicolinate synthase [Acidimicrobiia bacterium]|nr:4-hydroxy-tetrahydrodipicolinate synthase [Acidimicrobiia bacterium]MYC58164.1 4-hydroxy-tetrahydrodipicolinate synthase [Acidimicrobiia bacterium]MYG94349.1 4-hydroxy-tetrahydrodipicolinate synthase [Acidimicrobiia bacterium]MYI30596.1 4-hydroxy-tetrahydrodipicolinate synthase [Acidimicrobiia bacterium]
MVGSAQFGKVLTAMVTPFRDDGSLNTAVAALLAQWLVSNGNDGLVVAGTTGESPTLTHDEQAELIAAVVAATDVAVIAGAGSNDTAAAVDLTQRATQAGAHGILSVTPYYNRPSQAALIKHFTAVAAATHLPVLIYDIPVRTGRKVDTATLLYLASEVPNIVGVKDAAGDPGETAKLIAEAPDGFEVYSGDDGLTLSLLAVGAVGVIGVATHWTGVEHAQMIAAFEQGDVAAARSINANLMPSFAYETSPVAPNPIPAKAMMRLLGIPVGFCRPPMDVEPEGLSQQAAQVLVSTALAGVHVESAHD